jgi:hypothetical protein
LEEVIHLTKKAVFIFIVLLILIIYGCLINAGSDNLAPNADSYSQIARIKLFGPEAATIEESASFYGAVDMGVGTRATAHTKSRP